MEPIEVTAHFSKEGTITPQHFIWNAGHYRVESTGRRWSDEVGQHMLVMVTSGVIYELIFASSDGRWFISRVRPERTVI
jgi:hypothetical protein